MKQKDLHYPQTWEERRPSFVDGVFFVPNYFFKHDEFELPELFSQKQPICLEFCSGNGEWIIDRAKERPDCNWIAVEMRFDRVRKIWAKMKNQGIENLVVICAEALTFSKNYLAEQFVDEIYINFPDPWPKEKHAKNRLIRTPFVEELERISKNGAKLTLVTDDVCYSEQMIDELLHAKHFVPEYESPYFVQKGDAYGSSFFDRLWKEKGRKARLMQFNLDRLQTRLVDLTLESKLEIASADSRTLWICDFGLQEANLFDEMAFRSRLLAFERFLDQMGSADEIRLYEGPAGDIPMLSEYLHRIASIAPDDIRLTVKFDLPELEPSEFFSLFSEERFPHIEVLNRPRVHSKVALSLPQDEYLSDVIQKRFDALYTKMKGQCRVIPERLLTEKWQGVDKIVAIEVATSPYGFRSLQGFEVAGGVVEMDRGRGI